MNLNTIAANVATRFSAANITPPTGLDNIALATHLLPQSITTTPCVLVKPPAGEFEFGSFGVRVGELKFPVEIYFTAAADNATNASNMYAWYGTLIEQLKADYDIGTAAEVIDATVVASRMGTLTYAGIDYPGIQFTVRVRLAGAYNAST